MLILCHNVSPTYNASIQFKNNIMIKKRTTYIEFASAFKRKWTHIRPIFLGVSFVNAVEEWSNDSAEGRYENYPLDRADILSCFQ